MITIHTTSKRTTSRELKDINKENSILIIGQGADSTMLNEIIKPSSISDARSIYGECPLLDAYTDAVNCGATNVFVINCYKTTDYIKSIERISQYNFSYIVVTGMNFSDKFFMEELNREVYYAEYCLQKICSMSNSTIIFTDSHAELYENINHYLADMTEKVVQFKEDTKYLLDRYGERLLFCLNSLTDINYSNVILAAQLSCTDIGKYPDGIRKKSVYDMDKNDISVNEIIFFQNNTNVSTSIENLNNFRTTFDANKVVTIFNVIRYIESSMDFSFVTGKLYNPYTEMSIHDYVDAFFRKNVADKIISYSINNISFVANDLMSGYVQISLSVTPINSLEAINVNLEVG